LPEQAQELELELELEQELVKEQELERAGEGKGEGVVGEAGARPVLLSLGRGASWSGTGDGSGDGSGGGGSGGGSGGSWPAAAASDWLRDLAPLQAVALERCEVAWVDAHRCGRR
jgi:hypothetical protein